MKRSKIRYRLAHVFAILSLFAVFQLTGASCGHVREVPVTTQIVYNYVDSTRIHDSIVVVPVERYTDITRNYDTLNLETSLAKATCWVDSLFLKGVIYNKNTYTQKTEYIDHYITKDSLVYRDRPVPIEVEKIVKKNAAWPVWLWAIASTLLLGFLIYLRAKRLCFFK